MASSSEVPKVQRAIMEYMNRRSDKKLTAKSPNKIAELLGLSDMSGSSLVAVLGKLRSEGVIRFYRDDDTGKHTITLGSGRAHGRGRRQGGRKRK